jgi:hypothetical protein
LQHCTYFQQQQKQKREVLPKQKGSILPRDCAAVSGTPQAIAASTHLVLDPANSWLVPTVLALEPEHGRPTVQSTAQAKACRPTKVEAEGARELLLRCAARQLQERRYSDAAVGESHLGKQRGLTRPGAL